MNITCELKIPTINQLILKIPTINTYNQLIIPAIN